MEKNQLEITIECVCQDCNDYFDVPIETWDKHGICTDCGGCLHETLDGIITLGENGKL